MNYYITYSYLTSKTCCIDLGFKIFLDPGAHQRKIAPMASTKLAFYIYYLLIISPNIHVYVYYMVFAKLLQENYLKNLF